VLALPGLALIICKTWSNCTGAAFDLTADNIIEAKQMAERTNLKRKFFISLT
jgi:hypothetical protein